MTFFYWKVVVTNIGRIFSAISLAFAWSSASLSTMDVNDTIPREDFVGFKQRR